MQDILVAPKQSRITNHIVVDLDKSPVNDNWTEQHSVYHTEFGRLHKVAQFYTSQTLAETVSHRLNRSVKAKRYAVKSL